MLESNLKQVKKKSCRNGGKKTPEITKCIQGSKGYRWDGWKFIVFAISAAQMRGKSEKRRWKSATKGSFAGIDVDEFSLMCEYLLKGIGVGRKPHSNGHRSDRCGLIEIREEGLKKI